MTTTEATCNCQTGPTSTPPSNSSMDADITPSKTIATSVSLYFPMLIIAVILYEIIRRKWENIYNSRKFKEDTTCTVAEKQYGILGWVLPALKTSDDDIFQDCGLDSLCFLRLLRMGQKFAICGILLSVFLFPTYATGTHPREEQRSDIDPLERLTMTNLSSKEDRLWASVLGMYIMTFFALYLFVQEYRIYVKRRHEFLGRVGSQQYSIVINYLPKKYRSRQTLRQYMEYVFPNTVQSVHVALESDRLESKVEERSDIRNSLEHALAVYDSTGKRPTHIVLKRGAPVDSIQYYQERLVELNSLVALEIERLRSHEIEVGSKLAELEKLQRSTSPEPDSTEDEEQGQGDADTLEIPARASDQLRNSPSPSTKLKLFTRQSAFVSFTTLRSAQVAQQLLQTEDPSQMKIGPAPHPRDIVWENIGYALHERKSWNLASWFATFVIILFWTVPTAFVASLATVESLEAAFPPLHDLLEKNEALKGMIKQISPLALVVMPIAASIIFGILSRKEGHASLTQANSSHFQKLVYFQTFQTFFVSIIAGSLFDIVENLKHIVENPQSIVGHLGGAIPTQSTTFMAFLIVQMGLKLTLELLRVVPLSLGLVYSLFAPKVTPREQESPWVGLTPARMPGEFIQTLKLADYFLAILLLFSFCAIAPLLSYFALLYFFLSDVVYRRQLLFVYDPSKYSTGVYWPKLHNCLVGALFLAQITFLGLITLKISPGPIFASTALPFFTVAYYLMVKSMWPITAKNLPLNLCCSLDRARAGNKECEWGFLDKVYEQPALEQGDPIRPANPSGNDSQFELVPPAGSTAKQALESFA